MPERLQKILAQHGLGSRREIERWIVEGRITVNLQVAKVGAHFSYGDRIAIDGKEVTARLTIEVPKQVLMYHKAQGQPIAHDDTRTTKPPVADTPGEVQDSTQDDADVGETVLDRLPAIRGSRWIPINPMHAGDSGLLLLTNDGALSYALTRHKREIPTGYLVRVLSPGSSDTRLTGAPEIPPQVTYDDKEVNFTSVEPAGGEGSNLWYRVELPRADHRAAVRALFESRDLKVSRMTQVSFGNVELPRDLPRGRHRALTSDQIAELYGLAQIASPALQPSHAPHEVTRTNLRKPRAVAPDRRAASKKATAQVARDNATRSTKYDASRDSKRAAKQSTAPKKVSTWRIGGKKRPQGDSQR
jgi:23S rRNA pseudouridine2605 synthase